MSNYMEYHPKLGFQRKIEPQIEPREVDDETSDDSNEIKEAAIANFLEVASIRGYRPSSAILDLMRNPASDILESLCDTNSRIKTVLESLIRSLEDTLAKGPSIQDYIIAKGQNDLDTVFAFEDYHSSDIKGSTAAEAVSIMMTLQEEIETVRSLANTYFFKGTANCEDLSKERDNEVAELNRLIAADEAQQGDLDQVAEDNQLKYYFQNKAVMANDFIDSIQNILSSTLDTYYPGQVIGIINALSESNQALPQIEAANKGRFEKYAAYTQDVKDRMDRVASTDFKVKIVEETARKQANKISNKAVIQFIEANNPTSDSHPMNVVMYDLLEGVEQINNKSNRMTRDLFKVSQLEQVQLNDYLTSLDIKQCTRKFDQLVDGLNNNFDFNDSNRPQQIESFMRSEKL